MIPKIIHYCWFGGKPIPKLESRCMESWKKYLPGYQVMRWDETTFDVNSVPFTKAAYEAHKYAYVADYVRLYALSNYGGVYLDTDIEVIKSMDELMLYEAVSGFETPNVIQTGVMAFQQDNPILKAFLNIYHHIPFETDGKGNVKTKPNSAILANLLVERGLKLDNTRQDIEGLAVFPQEYFCPIDQATREQKVTSNTYCIHYLSGSWFSWKLRLINNTKLLIGRHLGYGVISAIRKLIMK